MASKLIEKSEGTDLILIGLREASGRNVTLSYSPKAGLVHLLGVLPHNTAFDVLSLTETARAILEVFEPNALSDCSGCGGS